MKQNAPINEHDRYNVGWKSIRKLAWLIRRILHNFLFYDWNYILFYRGDQLYIDFKVLPLISIGSAFFSENTLSLQSGIKQKCGCFLMDSLPPYRKGHYN